MFYVSESKSIKCLFCENHQSLLQKSLATLSKCIHILCTISDNYNIEIHFLNTKLTSGSYVCSASFIPLQNDEFYATCVKYATIKNYALYT